ncbi:hypothetical protein EVAR_94007_1 [Eumeta japonica]|uniref:Reverse transcriptase domain-containing protein n=1 Tax=Eumeta variegata TaxID=151549 RepID=A0A4C1TPE2_EUMVA|nr:hypothetical protein EVAR_94007_1 [Eumeta japonica]
MLSRFPSATSLISVASRKGSPKPLEPKEIWLPSHSAKSKRWHPQARETTRPPASYRPISLPERSGQTIRKILKTRLDHLLGKGLIIDEQFGFRPAILVHSKSSLVEYVSEALKPNSTVAVFFDVAKAFDRQTDISHLGMSALTRQDVLSEQEFLKAPPSLLCTPRTQTMYRDRRRLASNSRYSRTIPRSLRK